MNESCAPYDSYSTTRFVAISLASVVAAVGIWTNLTLTTVFFRIMRKAERSQKTVHLYLTVLSICEAIFSFCFCVLFGVDAFALYWRVPLLFSLYFVLILPVFSVSFIVLLVIPYLIVLATFEKWLTTSHHFKLIRLAPIFTTAPARVLGIGVVFAVSLMVRVPTAWAYTVLQFPNCTDKLGRMQLYPTDFCHSAFYSFLDLYIVSILDVVLPFVSLITLNVGVLYNMRMGLRQSHLEYKRNISGACTPAVSFAIFNDLSGEIDTITEDTIRAPSTIASELKSIELEILKEEEEAKTNAKQTTFSILMLVTSYLLCTAPSFILTVLEHTKPKMLLDEDGNSNTLYLVWGDLVSVLFMFNSFLSMFILYYCDNQIRDEIRSLYRSRKIG